MFVLYINYSLSSGVLELVHTDSQEPNVNFLGTVQAIIKQSYN